MPFAGGHRLIQSLCPNVQQMVWCLGAQRAARLWGTFCAANIQGIAALQEDTTESESHRAGQA